ncbi:conserved hypothetical protein [Perkinsus marinus ATCC 50983]|uniref:Pheromone shutdown protein n=1 Tax=Perkinsus marinus (strain ATCC 50983 / TXsc) TaxID=423536 RepID=C5KP50_PERM5|nr:conserved hypothetical protein [Perkinsus marinus ATCC 50983]EER13725.1 conserved hypothetical protein [Perkinsus marinus ATCC 50983]|eukprot:XP_002781930.1 conserved hypothetical protein [Perkinsus marinus ATCC 50983]
MTYLHTVKEAPRPNIPPRTFHLVGLMQDRLFGNASAQAAAEAIRTLHPRQVMLEMDQARYKNALEHISTGMHLQQPNRVDIVSTVHGGLMLRELKASIEAAKEINAAIYLIDRPFTITKNRVAQKLLNPVTFGNFLKYGNRSLVFRKDKANSEDVRELDSFLKRYCPGIHKVLIDERNQYMAHQIIWNSQPGETVVVICSAMHVPGLASLLQKKLADPSVNVAAPEGLADLTKKSLPVVPFLFLFYLVLPGYILYLVSAGGIAMISQKTKGVLGIESKEGEVPVVRPAVKKLESS